MAHPATRTKLEQIAAEQHRQVALLNQIKKRLALEIKERKAASPNRPAVQSAEPATPAGSAPQSSRPKRRRTTFVVPAHCQGVRPIATGEKIFGGKDAKIGCWPGHIALRIRNRSTNKSFYFCGGTLIDQRWVVTAAHCVYRPRPKRDAAGYFQRFYALKSFVKNGFTGIGHIEIVSGTGNLKNVDLGNVAGVKQIIIHPGYDIPSLHKQAVCGDSQCPNVTGHDIALLELDQPIPGPFGRLSMNGATDPFDDIPVPAMVAGFGRTDWNKGDIGYGLHLDDKAAPQSIAASFKLKEADLSIIRQDDCQRKYGPSAIGPGQICAADTRTSTTKDTCHGDSGGPLVVYDDRQRAYIVGLTSWGKRCAAPGSYGVYTRVSNFADWIRKYVDPVHATDPADTAGADPQLVARGRKEFRRGMQIFGRRLKPADGSVELRICSYDGSGRKKCEQNKRLRHNERFTIETTSKRPGRLILVNVTPFGYANLLYQANQATGARMAAGVRLSARNITTHLISDRGRILAFVVPDERIATSIIDRMTAAHAVNPVATFNALVDGVNAALIADPAEAKRWGYKALALDVRY